MKGFGLQGSAQIYLIQNSSVKQVSSPTLVLISWTRPLFPWSVFAVWATTPYLSFPHSVWPPVFSASLVCICARSSLAFPGHGFSILLLWYCPTAAGIKLCSHMQTIWNWGWRLLCENQVTHTIRQSKFQAVITHLWLLQLLWGLTWEGF